MGRNRKTQAERRHIDEDNHEECDFLSSLIPAIIHTAPETRTWTSLEARRTIILATNSREYQVQADRLRKTLDRTIDFDVLSIERIESPFLMAGFLLRRGELQAMKPKMRVRTRTMFHATSRKATNEIIKHGFDWSLSGRKNGHRWGYGTCFTPYADFAAKFVNSGNGTCYVLMCLVLERNTMIGSKGLDIPDDDCDTTRSKSGKVFVKYDDYTAYPAYRIQYEMFKYT